MSELRPEQKRVQLFVIRLWAEQFDEEQDAWRGEVVHPASDTGRYFARWEDLLAFLCEAVGVPWEGNVAREIMMEVIKHESDED